MNKKISVMAVAAAALLSASALAGCAPKPDPADFEPSPHSTRSTNPNQGSIEITIEEPSFAHKTILPGVRRLFLPSPAGNYGVEYIHHANRADKDETLDYRIALHSDNTYEMTVVSNGVTADHSGKWYVNRGSITFFYDEETENQPHNVYEADCLYGNFIDGGKIMIYDNCNVIVLSKTAEPDQTPAE